jgi:thymidylate synthase (FAD)
MDSAWRVIAKLLESGVKPEIARYGLPNACSTEIICTWNFREIRHIIKLRTSPAALPEIRLVISQIKSIMQEKAPAVFGDL